MTSAEGMERTFLISELGHNHNGDFSVAKRMVETAAQSGADAVKIQCRTLPDAIPEAQRDVPKVVPWTGETMSYVDYRRLVEFSDEQILELDELANNVGVEFFASCWDVAQVDRIRGLIDPRFYKIASACATDEELVRHTVQVADGRAMRKRSGAAVIASTGGLDRAGVDRLALWLSTAQHADVWLGQCTATYPCPPQHTDLRVIQSWIDTAPGVLFDSGIAVNIGFSNHGVSIAPLVAAVALGAEWLEVHFTLDRSMPGTDQAASFEPSGLAKLRSYVDTVTSAMGDGVKRVQPGEAEVMRKLRRVG